MVMPATPASAPIDQPQYGATLRQGATRFFRKYATFSGRASQSELWWGLLVVTVLTTIAAVPYVVTFGGQMVTMIAELVDDRPPSDSLSWQLASFPALLPLLAVSWGTLVPTYALIARRMHDVGWSGWLAALQYPTSGWWAIVAGFLPTRAEGLRYEQPGSMALLTPEAAAQAHAMEAYAAQQRWLWEQWAQQQQQAWPQQQQAWPAQQQAGHPSQQQTWPAQH